MDPADVGAPTVGRPRRTALKVAGILGGALVVYVILAWLGGPVPAPCGHRICGPLSHCVHVYGVGNVPSVGPVTIPDDEYRCEPGMGRWHESPRPGAAAAGPAPCGTQMCGPSMHCVHEYGQGAPPPPDAGLMVQADVYRCEPGAGPPIEAARPVAPPMGNIGR